MKQPEYNRWFRAMVARHCPDLFSEISEEEWAGTEYLMAKIPHPDARRVINVSTYGSELTVFIHAHHCHFDQFEHDDHEQEFANAVEWICDFMHNRVLICTQYAGDRVVASTATYNREDLKPQKNCRMEILNYQGDCDFIDTPGRDV